MDSFVQYKRIGKGPGSGIPSFWRSCGCDLSQVLFGLTEMEIRK